MKGKEPGMDEQLTAARVGVRGGTRDELSRARLWLMVGLPLYAAVTAAMMTAMFVAIPLLLYSIADDEFAGFGILFFTVLFSPLIPGAVWLALMMRAVLNRLHLQDAPRRDTQAWLMLMFSEQLPMRLPIWKAALWSVGAVVVSVLPLGTIALVVNFLLVWLLLSFVPILYPVAFAAAGLALAVSMAAALRRMLLKRRDKWILKIALVAVACATAGTAVVAALAVMDILQIFGAATLSLAWTISILLLPLGFLLLPPLLRASAAYARLRNEGGSAP